MFIIRDSRETSTPLCYNRLMQIVFLIIMFILGACLGSFLCCQARRLHLKETKKKKLGPRSICLNCKTRIKWYDNLPIISWFILKGKCRTCGKKIGAGEVLSELGCALAFFILALGAYLNGLTIDLFLAKTSLEYGILATLIVLIVSLLFLAIYDGLYGELPVLFLTISIICAIIIVFLKQWIYFSSFDLFLSVLILGGLYLALYLISKGKWVGDGDWLLGVAIGLTLGKPFLALLTLFLSNFLACLIMAPKAKGKNLKIPFGPFLVAAFIIIYSFAEYDIISL